MMVTDQHLYTHYEPNEKMFQALIVLLIKSVVGIGPGLKYVSDSFAEYMYVVGRILPNVCHARLDRFRLAQCRCKKSTTSRVLFNISRLNGRLTCLTTEMLNLRSPWPEFNEPLGKSFVQSYYSIGCIPAISSTNVV